MRWCCLAALVMGVLVSARDADADEPKPTWYGYEALIADALFIGVAATTPLWHFDAGPALGVADAAAFGLTAPMIHSVHDHADVALASFGLHVGVPLAGMLVGLTVASAFPSSCGEESNPFLCANDNLAWGAYAGLVSGAGLGAILDAVLLAWEKPSSHGLEPSPTRTWSVAPYALHGGAGLGVACAF